MYAYPKSTDHTVTQEWRRWWWRVWVPPEHPFAEPVRSHAFGTLLGPVTAASASIALLRIAHARPLSNATRRYLYLHGLPVHHHTVQLFDGVVHVSRRFEMDEAVIAYDVTLDDSAVFFEKLAYLRRLGVVREVPDKYLRSRCLWSLATLRCFTFHRLAVQNVPVQVLYSFTSLGLVFHVDEAVILDDVAFHHLAILFEQWT